MGSLFQVIKNAITHVFQGVQGSYAFSLLGKAFIRLRTAVMNPFQRVVRRIQQLFNANIITSKLVAPINAKVRKILSGEAKSPEDYFTVGRFWISRMLVYFLILAGCAAIFIYFNWIASPVSDTTATENVTTTVYYDYDDVDLGEYTGKPISGQQTGMWSIPETFPQVSAQEMEPCGPRMAYWSMRVPLKTTILMETELCITQGELPSIQESSRKISFRLRRSVFCR